MNKKPVNSPARNEMEYLGNHLWYTEGFYSQAEQWLYERGYYFSSPYEELEGPYPSIGAAKEAMLEYSTTL